MADLTLSESRCDECDQPLVEQWLVYRVGPETFRHANCDTVTRALANTPERFGLETPA